MKSEEGQRPRCGAATVVKGQRSNRSSQRSKVKGTSGAGVKAVAVEVEEAAQLCPDLVCLAAHACAHTSAHRQAHT
eukprot:172038-Rhodomonas_salina.1